MAVRRREPLTPLPAEPPDQPSDHRAAERAEDEDGRLGLRDHRVRRAEEDAGREADHPRREGERGDLRRPDDGADHDANGEPIEECAQEGRPLIGELERKHRRGREDTVEHSGEETEGEAGHKEGWAGGPYPSPPGEVAQDRITDARSAPRAEALRLSELSTRGSGLRRSSPA